MDIKNLIRAGVVSEVEPDKCAARVTFEDRDGLVSAVLPVLQTSCLSNKFYSLPDVGDSVLCLMLPNDTEGNGGFILGSFYTDKNPPPAQARDISTINFGDGTTVTYDRAKHLLSINCVGNISINGERIDLNA